MYYCHIHTQRNKSNHGGSDGEVEVDGTAPPEATNSENHDQAMDQATEQSLDSTGAYGNGVTHGVAC